MSLDLSSLERAVHALREALDEEARAAADEAVAASTRRVLRAGVIQSFEFTYELGWKFMKRWLDGNLGSTYVEGVARRELFRLAAEHGLIGDVERWMDYHFARNRTSHTYEEDTAEDVLRIARGFADDAARLAAALHARND